MQTFKKCLASFLVFMIILIITSSIIIYIFFNTESTSYQDLNLRNKLAGTIDTLVLGSSEGHVAFKINIMDDNLKGKSYNLCGSACPPSGIKALLDEEINRNPLKTVIIDIGSFLHYDYTKSVSEGEIGVIPRLSDKSKRIDYMLKNVWINNYSYLYAAYINNGISTLKNLIFGTYIPEVTGNIDASVIDENIAGVDLSLSNDEILNKYIENKTTEKNIFWNKPAFKNYELLKEMVNDCKIRGIQVILVFVPMTEARIWTKGNFETEKDCYEEFARQNDCVYLDFNLIKDRNRYFSDKISFNDGFHMSGSGAQIFTKIFCNVLNKIHSGEDVSDMFYDSYDEAIKHFEYYDTYQKLINEQG